MPSPCISSLFLAALAQLASPGDSIHFLQAPQTEQQPTSQVSVKTLDAQADMIVAFGRDTEPSSARPMIGHVSRSQWTEDDDPPKVPQQAPLPKPEPARAAQDHVVRSDRHYVSFVIKAVIILAAALILFLTYQVTAEVIERHTMINMQHMCCLVFMILSVSTDLSTKAAAGKGGGHYQFDPAVAVVVVEACKFLASVGLMGVTSVTKLDGQAPVFERVSIQDIAILAVPGLVYTCNNILVFEAIQRVPIATFAVVRETRLIWNAVIWMAIFKVNIGWRRVFAIIGVLLACTANQVPAMLRSEFSWNVLYAFLLAFLNAAGGVVCEFAMKRKAAMNINLQNAIIYTSCSSLALLYLAAFRPHVFVSAKAFFAGFEPSCLQVIVLQVINGLTVSRILKHVESITKSMVSAFCSPVVCFIGAWALHTKLHVNEVVAAVVVVASCCYFLRQGPLTTGPPSPQLPTKILDPQKAALAAGQPPAGGKVV